MKILNTIILCGLLILSCSVSPEKMLEKGDKLAADSQYEEAISTYQKLIEKFPEESLAQSAQYNIAWIELDEKANYSDGLNLLNKIAEKYPEEEIGISAAEDVKNFPNWLVSKSSELRSDTTAKRSIETLDFLAEKFPDHPIIPESLYLKGNIYLNDKKDFYRAINTYQQIVTKYKGSSFEPLSQFMIGYIHANVQTDISKARTAYKTFLQKYPEHELAPSVQFELDYLGKQINDIENLTNRK